MSVEYLTFPAEYFAKAKVGEDFNISSGMGGSFTVKLESRDEAGRMHLVVTNKDWPYTYNLTNEEAAERLYITIPDHGGRTIMMPKGVSIDEIAADKHYSYYASGGRCKVCHRGLDNSVTWHRCVGDSFIVCDPCWQGKE